MSTTEPTIVSFYTGRAVNCKNSWQGSHRRVLCVCSAGLLRSPTAALVLASPPFNFNTRAAGIEPCYALVPVDDILLLWADEIVCMTRDHEQSLREKLVGLGLSTPVVRLDIQDTYAYRDPGLMRLVAEKYQAATEQ